MNFWRIHWRTLGIPTLSNGHAVTLLDLFSTALLRLTDDTRIYSTCVAIITYNSKYCSKHDLNVQYHTILRTLNTGRIHLYLFMEFSTFFAFLFLSLTRMNWYIRNISFPQIPPLLDIPSKFSSPINNVTLTILKEFVHQRYLKKKEKNRGIQKPQRTITRKPQLPWK